MSIARFPDMLALIKKAEVCLMRQYICIFQGAFVQFVYGRTLTWIAGSNPAGGMDVSLVSVVCCQVEVFASSRSLVQRIPTECVWVIQCDLKNFRNEAGEAGVGLLR
jgi:hypothetical protein